MTYYAGIDVSLEYSSVCVVDGAGKIIREQRIASEPEALIAWFRGLGFGLERIGLEAGPMSQGATHADASILGCLSPCDINIGPLQTFRHSITFEERRR
jgi:hypothetical protein